MATDTSPSGKTRLVDYVNVVASITSTTTVEVTAPDLLDPIRLTLRDGGGNSVMIWIDLDDVFRVADALFAGRRERLAKNEAIRAAQPRLEDVEVDAVPEAAPAEEVPF